MWRSLGFVCWSVVGWAITFSYVVVAWVFFRAEELSDAIKVLSGMAGLNGVRLPAIFEQKLPVLKNYGFEFGNSVININGNWNTLLWVFLGLLAVLFLKNSIELKEKFKPGYPYLILTTSFSCLSILMLGQVSELSLIHI